MSGDSREVVRKFSLVKGEDSSLKAWLGLLRVHQKMQRQLDCVLETAGLTLPQFDVLANLGMAEGMTQQDLAERLLVTKANVCGLLDRMELADLVHRRPDAQDRRANRLYLTRHGRSALRKAFPAHLGLISQCMRALSSAELLTLADMLSRIEHASCFD